MDLIWNLSKEQELIRKRWLRCFKFRARFIFFCLCIWGVCGFVECASGKLGFFCGVILLYALLWFIMFFFEYRCAYKKPGIGWLTYCMIGCAWVIVKQTYNLFALADVFWPSCLVLIFLWELKTSWALCKLNEEIQKQNPHIYISSTRSLEKG